MSAKWVLVVAVCIHSIVVVPVVVMVDEGLVVVFADAKD